MISLSGSPITSWKILQRVLCFRAGNTSLLTHSSLFSLLPGSKTSSETFPTENVFQWHQLHNSTWDLIPTPKISALFKKLPEPSEFQKVLKDGGSFHPPLFVFTCALAHTGLQRTASAFRDPDPLESGAAGVLPCAYSSGCSCKDGSIWSHQTCWWYGEVCLCQYMLVGHILTAFSYVILSVAAHWE